MASDARAKANPEGPRTWVAIALFLLFLIYVVDKYFYDIPNFLDDEFEESHTTQLKPRSETLPAAMPHYDALQKRLAEEKALSSTWTPKQKAEDKKWASQLKPLWGLEHNPKADVVMSLSFENRNFLQTIESWRSARVFVSCSHVFSNISLGPAFASRDKKVAQCETLPC